MSDPWGRDHPLAYKFNNSWQSQPEHRPPRSIFAFLLIAAGGVLAFVWHPAALALSAWGVYVAALSAYAQITKKLFALNDSLIEINDQMNGHVRTLNQTLYEKLGPFSRR